MENSQKTDNQEVISQNPCENCTDGNIGEKAKTEVKKPACKSNLPKGKSVATKKREQQDYRRKYFEYYDDVKTNIKEDW